MYLEDMNLAMKRIAEYIHGFSFAEFKADNKTTDAVIRNFEIIGEAAKNLPPDFKINFQIYPGKKCICYEIKYLMNISVLIMK